MDLIAYRKKTNHPKPLPLLRELYYNYKRTLSIRNNKPRFDSHMDPLAKQTVSIEKFQKCLHNIQALDLSCGERKGEGGQGREEKGRREGKVMSDYDGGAGEARAKGKMWGGEDLSRMKKKGYFKTDFSNTVDILKPHPSIQSLLQNQPSPRLQIAPSVPLPPNNPTQMQKPTKQYFQMQLEKRQLEQKIYKKKSKTQQIRKSWLLDKIYKDPTKDCVKQQGRVCRMRGRQDFQLTKENIFPVL